MADDDFIVLIAEDDEYSSLPTKLYLTRHGIQTRVVEGPEALLHEATAADALVVDVKLPNATEGLDTVVKLLDQNALRPSVPIVFISNWSRDKPPVQPKLSLPVLQNRYIWLGKPFESEYLLRLIREDRQRRASLRP